MRRTLQLALFFSMIVWNVASSEAAMIQVDASEVAVNPGNNACSLREAIANAESGGETSGGDCTAGTVGPDTLELTVSTYDLLDAAVTDPIYGATGLPEINSEITVHGNGATIQRSPTLFVTTPCDGVGAKFRILFVGTSGDLTLEDITLRNGCADFGGTGAGGAIFNRGVLAIHDTTVSNNAARSSAGAIQNDGELEMTRSTLSFNATTFGAGGAVVSTGTLSMLQSTVNNNSTPGAGGALFNAVSNLTTIIANSTLSSNTSNGTGGGLQNNSNAALTNVTVAFNHGNASASNPGPGSGIYRFAGTVTLANSIVAEQINGSNCFDTSSLIANLADDLSCPLFSTSIAVNLGPLMNNGGPTDTHALLFGSAAIDTGDNATCAAPPINNVDQRDNTRPQFGSISATCDIGSFEAGRPVGQPCTDADDCLASNCVDGVCCAADCTDVCESCAAAVTGQANGTCAPVLAGQQTDNGCSGMAGVCDGSAAGAAACVGGPCQDDGDCGGQNCVDEVCCPADCTDVCESCASAVTGQANGTCAPVLAGGQTDNGCTGGVCDGSAAGAAACIGGPCLGDGDCGAQNCVDGVCCPADCTDVCESCASAVTGQANGTCAPVLAGQQTANGCSGMAGVCEGSAAGSAACVGGPCQGDVDCGGQNCVDGVCCPADCTEICESCASAVTGQANGTCAPVLAGQQTDNGCTGGVCDGSAADAEACVGGLGGPCSSDTLCASGFCSRGVCCESSCSGVLESCELPGFVGQCRVLPQPVPLLTTASLALAVCMLAFIGLLALYRPSEG